MSEYHAFGIDTVSQGKGTKIILREEQRAAVDLAKKHFGKTNKADGSYILDGQSRQFLWNAKMRFGKTICALQLVREMNVKRVLIVTHRPVVNKGWFEDFRKIFSEPDVRQHWNYGTKSDNDDFGSYYDLEKFIQDEGNHYIFFVSMQYLRRSVLVGGDNEEPLKKDLLNTDWDLVIVDEAHEGTRTILGQRVIDILKKSRTKMLHLSGTPFNLYSDFKESEIFTWDYIQEQQAKRDWPLKHGDEANPYADLPVMKILTFDLGKLLDKFIEGGASFKFTDFFRTWTGNPKADGAIMPEGKKERFVHEDSVTKFLDKLCEESPNSNYPFSTDTYRENFHHTLWIVPGVKEAKALTQLLREHEVFQFFDIINVAGNNYEDEERENALDKVKEAIGEQPEKTYTITISCGRLTAGVTVPAWTAVFYLKGSEMTSAATYMQTIFRVQSPAIIDGRMKTECYVFDFAPDRTLKMIAETAKFSSQASKTRRKKDDGEEMTQEERDKETMREFVSLCPVVSLDEGQMQEFDVNRIFHQLERVYIDRLVLNGFNDNCLYNTEELMKINSKVLNELGAKIASSSNMERPKRATPNDELALNQLTDEQRTKLEEARRRARENRENNRDPYDGLSEEELEAIKAEKERKRKEREERDKRISNIRGIALRIPLMMYGGAETESGDEPLTVNNFTKKIKDESWAEFMPRGVTKDDFNYVRRVFNATRFEEAGKRYRELAKEADSMHTEERIRRIAKIFACFHNPDKETVLTPWRVVNMHLSDTLGGYCFFNEKFDGPNQKNIVDEKGEVVDTVETDEPRFVERGGVTHEVFGNSEAKILEINSKTGLYPLYVTYSLYRQRMKDFYNAELIEEKSVEEEQVVWDDIVKNNIYILCNTPMAERITRRTLFGFRKVKGDHIKSDKIVEKAMTNLDELAKAINSVGYWGKNKNKEEMRFTAIVGNPPYQVMDGGAGASAKPVYNSFVEIAKKLRPKYISMIMPARWYAGGKGLDEFRDEMLNEKRIKVLVDYQDSRDCFPGVTIKGGICYFLWNRNYSGKCEIKNMEGGKMLSCMKRTMNEKDIEIFVRYNEAIAVLKKVCIFHERSVSSIVSSRKPFGFASTFKEYKEKSFPNAVTIYAYKKVGYIDRSQILQNSDWVDLYKVFISEAYGAGEDFPHQIINKPFLGCPNTCCTETYLVIGPYHIKEEAENIISYIRTKFFRFLVLLKKNTQHATSKVYAFVPVQNFTKTSDIDWSKSIPEIDQQLYAKYHLTDEEIAFIEKMIKPME